jgi:hypothetical protein
MKDFTNVSPPVEIRIAEGFKESKITMWYSQTLMLNITMSWLFDKQLDKEDFLYMYMGKRKGHTILWKIICESAPETFIFCALNSNYLNHHEIKNGFALSRGNRIPPLKGKIVIVDAGGARFVRDHHIKKLDEAAGVIIS